MEVEVEVTQPVQQRDELNSSVGALQACFNHKALVHGQPSSCAAQRQLTNEGIRGMGMGFEKFPNRFLYTTQGVTASPSFSRSLGN